MVRNNHTLHREKKKYLCSRVAHVRRCSTTMGTGTVSRALTVLLCAEALLVAAMPLTGGPGDPEPLPALVAEERNERKVGAVDTEGPFGFVRQLQNELAYPDGEPKNPEEDPTDIWYILDKGAGCMQRRAWLIAGTRASQVQRCHSDLLDCLLILNVP